MVVYQTRTNTMQKKSYRTSSRFVMILSDAQDTTAAATWTSMLLSSYACDVHPRPSTVAFPDNHLTL